MSEDKMLDVLKKVQDIATLAGIRGRIDEEEKHFVAGFDLSEGRSQMVYVRLSGTARDGSTIVTIFSPCWATKTGFLKGMSKADAIGLLEKNENILFARYGVWNGKDKSLVVASVDRALETLDHKDFNALVWHVAVAADQLEKEHGGDRY